MSAPVGRKRTPKTRALIKQKALAQGLQRSGAIEGLVRTTMQTIEGEIALGDRIYPHNKGALSVNEVARRAGIHNTTLYGPRYTDLRTEVNTWLAAVKAKAVIGRTRVRREVVERVAEWRELYEGLLESHRISELHLQEAQRKLEGAQEELLALKKETRQLQLALSAFEPGKVVQLASKRRP